MVYFAIGRHAMQPESKTAEMPHAIRDAARQLYADAFLIRCFEERLLKLFSEGKLFGTVHTCIGQEFTGIAVARHLLAGDLIFTNHRCHGHYLARTGDVEGLMAEIMGRSTGICGGRGGSQHICSAGVYSNGVQGGTVPVAAGLALAQKMAGRGNVVVVFIGDGTLGEGVVYETLNVAARWNLPMAVVLENNGYSQSTQTAETTAGDILKRAEAFGIAAWHASTWDPAHLIDTMECVIGHAREQCRPAFVRVDTYRLAAHSKGDDERPAGELDQYRSMDPLNRFSASEPEEAAVLRHSAESRVSRAVELALPAEFTQIEPESAVSAGRSWQRTEIQGSELVARRIHAALREQMSQDSRALILGEDIEAPYGGAFKITRDLSDSFPGRVCNTPLSEAALVGLGTGLAMAGMRPICEIMFGDFLTLAADQIINHAAKFQWAYNGQVSVPMVIRTPMGGRRGYGPTHSQSIEKHFLGVPGLNVVAIHHRYDPYLLYRDLFAVIDQPTLVIENKALYGERVSHETIGGFWCEHTGGAFPATRIRSSAVPEITIVCYGGMLPEAEKAADRLFEEHEIVAEIICPTQICPLDVEPILESVRTTRRLLLVEEGQVFCGFGSEVAAAVHEGCPELRLLVRRQGAARHPLPASKPAELASLPGADSIVRDCVEMVRNG